MVLGLGGGSDDISLIIWSLCTETMDSLFAIEILQSFGQNCCLIKAQIDVIMALAVTGGSV